MVFLLFRVFFDGLFGTRSILDFDLPLKRRVSTKRTGSAHTTPQTKSDEIQLTLAAAAPCVCRFVFFVCTYGYVVIRKGRIRVRISILSVVARSSSSHSIYQVPGTVCTINSRQ